jgi:phosphoribosyl 1,2-cyclic phosphodiesterase
MPTSSGELEYQVDNIRVVGTSVAALATAFAVDRFKTAIDMGRCSALLAAQETVLLTHCHSDHVAGLVAWLSAHTRRHQGRPTRIVVPHERRQPLFDAIGVWPDLDGVHRRVDLDEAMVPARSGDVFDLPGGGWARAFSVHHSTPSLGWAVGASARERPWIAFAGDGTVQPFQDDPVLLDATLAIVDCSFVEPGTRVAARLSGHGHLQDWLALLPDLRCDALVLAHLPPEATAERILELVEGAAGGGTAIVPWILPPPGA